MAHGVFNRNVTISKHLISSSPGACWSLDCAPQLKRKSGKRVSIIVAVDDFSKYVVIGTLKGQKSSEVTEWMLTRVLSYFGKPDRIRVDNGNEFRDTFSVTMEALGI